MHIHSCRRRRDIASLFWTFWWLLPCFPSFEPLQKLELAFSFHARVVKDKKELILKALPYLLSRNDWELVVSHTKKTQCEMTGLQARGKKSLLSLFPSYSTARNLKTIIKQALVCLLISFDIFWCLLLNFDVCWCLLMPFDTFWCVLMSFDVFQCISMSFDAFCCLSMTFVVF